MSNGSIADMVLTLKTSVSKEDLNKTLKQASEESELKGMLAYTEEPMVSTDIVGDSHSSIVDGLSTMVLKNNKNNVVKTWYDNEWSYFVGW